LNKHFFSPLSLFFSKETDIFPCFIAESESG